MGLDKDQDEAHVESPRRFEKQVIHDLVELFLMAVLPMANRHGDKPIFLAKLLAPPAVVMAFKCVHELLQ